jgi:protein-disulfide isomerase
MNKSMLAILLLLAVGVPAQNKSAQKSPPSASAKAEAFSLPPRASGSKDAPIVMEVFSDFQCPHCKQLYLSTLRRVIDDYCASGKVYLIHRDFPLDQIHRYARDAARWATASVVTGKYEAVVEALFTAQDTWGASGNIEAVVAGVLTPVELQKVKQVMSVHKEEIDAAIENDIFLGHQIQLTSTPTTKIMQKGATLSVTPGMFPYATLKSYLDSQLAK